MPNWQNSPCEGSYLVISVCARAARVTCATCMANHTIRVDCSSNLQKVRKVRLQKVVELVQVVWVDQLLAGAFRKNIVNT